MTPVIDASAKPAVQTQPISTDSIVQPKPFSTDFWITISFLGDAIMILLGLMLGFWIRFKSGWITFGVESQISDITEYFELISVGVAFLLGAFVYLRVYDKRNLLRLRRVALIMFKACTFWFFAYLGISLALKFDPPISRIYVASSYITCMGTLLAWRWMFHQLLQTDSVAQHLRQRLLFVGWNEESEKIAQAMQNDRLHPYEIIGCIPNPSGKFELPPPARIKNLGDYSCLPRIFQDHKVGMVMLSDASGSKEEVIDLANICEKEYVQLKVIPSYFQILISGLRLEKLSGVPVMGVMELPLDRLLNRALKRVVDIVGSFTGLIISAPLIGIFGTLVFLESPGPIFYRQVRTGRNGMDFGIWKIRSMRLDAETRGGAQWAKKADPRRLKVGAFMREWSIDEVPQFWNVLKGEMSLVGPRPERPELIADFKHQIPHYNARHTTKPGITGWAQVNGLRGDTSLVERIRYDLFYLENWSVWLDFQIMFQTFFRRDNAY